MLGGVGITMAILTFVKICFEVTVVLGVAFRNLDCGQYVLQRQGVTAAFWFRGADVCYVTMLKEVS